MSHEDELAKIQEKLAQMGFPSSAPGTQTDTSVGVVENAGGFGGEDTVAKTAPDPVEAPAVETVPADSAEQESTPEAVDPKAPEQEPELDYRQMYEKLLASHETLKGKTYAEVPRLHRENNELKESIKKLEESLASVQANKQTAQGSTDEGDDGDDDDLPEEVVSYVRKAEKRLEDKLSKTFQASEKQLRAIAEERFFAEVSKAHPDWVQVFNDDGFKGWLEEVDPVSFVPRKDLLQKADATLNYEWASKIFDAYKSGKPAVSVSQPVQPQEPEKIKKTVVRPSVNAQVVPVAGAPRLDPEPQPLKLDDYRKLLDDAQRGKISPHAYQEQKKIYEKALAEGRLT